MLDKLRIADARWILAWCLIALWLGGFLVVAQQSKSGDEFRDLELTAWGRSRSQSQTPPSSERRKQQSPVYVVKKSMPKGQSSVSDAEVGVSIWRLRRSNDSDEVKDIIHPKSGGPKEEWTPERIGAEPALPIGSYFRLSIESLRNGYLYVINRTKYADGTFGDPYLIFPTKRINNGNNAVKPGLVIQIPSQKDDPSYLELALGKSKKGERQESEEMIIFVAKQPYPDFEAMADRVALSGSRVDSLVQKYGRTSFERSEMKGGVGKAITMAESMAAKNPTILLTPNDPYPQTIYRVAAKADDSLLVIVRLQVSNKSQTGQ